MYGSRQRVTLISKYFIQTKMHLMSLRFMPAFLMVKQLVPLGTVRSPSTLCLKYSVWIVGYQKAITLILLVKKN